MDVRFQDETVWLTLDQMSTLFDRDKSTISRHIKNIFDEGELEYTATVAKFATVQMKGAHQAERQAEREQPMTMADWAEHLDRILTMGGEKLLQGAGSVSHEQAIDKAKDEYKKYQARTLSDVEKAYLDYIEELASKTKKE